MLPTFKVGTVETSGYLCPPKLFSPLPCFAISFELKVHVAEKQLNAIALKLDEDGMIMNDRSWETTVCE